MSNISGLYIRVSTMNQIDRESLQTQEERLKAYCIANGINEYKLYKDAGVSARDTNRPQLKALLNDIKNGNISKVFVVKLDRITRSIKDLIQLTEYFNKNNTFPKSTIKKLYLNPKNESKNYSLRDLFIISIISLLCFSTFFRLYTYELLSN